MTLTAMSGRGTLDQSITAWFGDRPITRSQVRAWEAKRAERALVALKAPVPSGDVEVRRAAIAAAKKALGRDEIERRLTREVKISDRLTKLFALGSGGRRRLSQIELVAPGIPADALVSWYVAHAEVDDEASMLAACPDHHLFRPTATGDGQEVWETPGGSPIASRFFFTLDETDTLVTPADPAFPVQMCGTARLADGIAIGGLRHQFQPEGDGVRARLTVEFPWLMGPLGPAAHRWHLACEFSNWLEAAAAELRRVETQPEPLERGGR